jgi:hypothetical protein
MATFKTQAVMVNELASGRGVHLKMETLSITSFME